MENHEIWEALTKSNRFHMRQRLKLEARLKAFEFVVFTRIGSGAALADFRDEIDEVAKSLYEGYLIEIEDRDPGYAAALDDNEAEGG